MTYQQTLDYLFSQLPMYQRQGKKAFKKDLKNIKKLCAHFDNPQADFDTIHIAGTNGKGTVAHMLAAVFMSAGFKVGLYTSPHYKDFRERIKVNGEFISKRLVSSFTKKVISQIESIKPSFFEITVAMAFDHFRRKEVDIAIIETGLGGRLDSTNIITPKLSVITNISLDHQSMLGNTLKKIAKEKAGIIKKGVPVIIGEKQEATKEVFVKKAKSKSAPLYFSQDLKLKRKTNKPKSKQIQNPYFDINSLSSRATIDIWNKKKLGKRISQKYVELGIANFQSISKYQGRWQILQKNPLVIADSAHNEGALNILMEQLLKSYKPNELHFVTGFVKDKHLDDILKLFPTDANYYFCKAKIPRALDAKDLKQKASLFGLEGKAYKYVKYALSTATKKAHAKDAVIVCGSIFIVAEVI